MKSKLPEPHSLVGDPKEEDYYKPFLIEQKEGWDYYWIRLYDVRKFTRTEPDYKKYLPNLSVPSYVLDILVGLYFRPGTIHGAKVMAIKVKGDTPKEEAFSWIRKNDLHTWEGIQIRQKHEESISIQEPEKVESPETKISKEQDFEKMLDEATKTILEQVKAQSENSLEKQEEKRLTMELKKKKLELIETWLRENKGET